MESNVSLRTGTVSGTVLSVLPNIASEDVFRTIVLAVVGAVASFFVTVVLHWLKERK